MRWMSEHGSCDIPVEVDEQITASLAELGISV